MILLSFLNALEAANTFLCGSIYCFIFFAVFQLILSLKANRTIVKYIPAFIVLIFSIDTVLLALHVYGTITYEPGPGIDLFSHDANGIIALSLIVPIAAAIIGILCGYAIYVWIERNFEIKRKPKNTEEENEN